MNTTSTPISGLEVVETHRHEDARGTFARLFCAHELDGLLGDRRVVQVNHSLTRQVGAVRGLHFQHAPHAETKFVRCVRGSVWDVAVDLRSGSDTFLRWHAIELSCTNWRMFAIPEGCAHGYQVLEPDSELLYLHTSLYTPAAESGIRWDDPRIAIDWPLPLPLAGGLSDRDRALPTLSRDFDGLPT